jgi:hypothetical protein
MDERHISRFHTMAQKTEQYQHQRETLSIQSEALRETSAEIIHEAAALCAEARKLVEASRARRNLQS